VGGQDAKTLGLIAGQGRLPLEVARGARRAGRRVVVAAFRGFADEGLEAEVDEFQWVYVGQVEEVIETLRRAGAREAVLAGKVPKENLFADSGLVRLDERAISILSTLEDRSDDAILRAVGDALEGAGIRMCSQGQFTPELLAPEGPIGSVAPTEEQLDDVAYAWPIAKAVGRLDVGQTVVVRQRSVLHEAGAGILAVEAERTIVLERERVARLADEAGICVFGVRDPDIGAESEVLRPEPGGESP
jgi:DUF1009 family protein